MNESMRKLFDRVLREQVLGKRWSELKTDEERREAMEFLRADYTISDMFWDCQGEFLREQIEEICNEAESKGVELNPEDCLFETSSQGWYFPRGRKPRVGFRCAENEGCELQINDVEYDYGRNGCFINSVEGEYQVRENFDLIQFRLEVDSKTHEVKFNSDFPGALRGICQVQVGAAGKLLDDVIGAIQEHCTMDVPDDWIQSAAEANDWMVVDRNDLGDEDYEDYSDDSFDEDGNLLESICESKTNLTSVRKMFKMKNLPGDMDDYEFGGPWSHSAWIFDDDLSDSDLEMLLDDEWYRGRRILSYLKANPNLLGRIKEFIVASKNSDSSYYASKILAL